MDILWPSWNTILTAADIINPLHWDPVIFITSKSHALEKQNPKNPNLGHVSPYPLAYGAASSSVQPWSSVKGQDCRLRNGATKGTHSEAPCPARSAGGSTGKRRRSSKYKENAPGQSQLGGFPLCMWVCLVCISSNDKQDFICVRVFWKQDGSVGRHVKPNHPKSMQERW